MKRALVLIALVGGLAGCAAQTGDTGSGGYVPSPGGAYSIGGPAYAPGGLDSNARQSFASGDVAAAEASFGQAVDVNPFDPIALNNLAVTKTEAGQFHEALALLQRAERLAPQNTEIAANLARLRSWNQNYAMQDGSTLGQGIDMGSFKNLPPEPPTLWDTRAAR